MIEIAAHRVPDIVDDAMRDDDVEVLERVIPRQAAKGVPPLGRFAVGFLINGGAYLAHGDARRAKRVLSAIADVGSAMFLASGRQGPVTFQLEGRLVQGMGGPPWCEETPWLWWVSFAAAICARNRFAIDALLRHPMDRFAAAPGERDRYHALLAETLKRFYENDPRWTEFAQRTTAAFAPEQLRIATPRTVENLRTLLPVLHAVAAGDQAAFTTGCADAIRAHKDRWSRGATKEASDGMVALEAAGIAALGVDRGLRFEIESPYTPRWLVEGTEP